MDISCFKIQWISQVREYNKYLKLENTMDILSKKSNAYHMLENTMDISSQKIQWISQVRKYNKYLKLEKTINISNQKIQRIS